MLPVSTTSRPAIFIGARSERRTRSASMAMWRGSVSAESSTANCSLPMRASVSCGPICRDSRREIVSSMLSLTSKSVVRLSDWNVSMSM